LLSVTVENLRFSNSKPRQVSAQGGRRCQIVARFWSWEALKREPGPTSLESEREMMSPRWARSLGRRVMRWLSTATQSTDPWSLPEETKDSFSLFHCAAKEDHWSYVWEEVRLFFLWYEW